MRATSWIALPLVAAAIAAAAPAPTFANDPVPHSSSTLNANWPGYRGPNRDGVYRQPIRVSWEGLTPMWKQTAGGGRASFAIGDGRAFTIEQRLRNEVVVA